MAQAAVLDASAVLAVLRREIGADKVRAVYEGAAISAVNQAEVASAFVEAGIPFDDVERLLNRQPLEIVPFRAEQIFETARLLRFTHHLHLSLADRACLALGRLRQAPVFTTDRAWRSLEIGVEIRLIR